jgi:hypothetical protein
MDETRHVARDRRAGGAHDRVLTLEEALAAIEAADADDIQRVAADIMRRRPAARRKMHRRATPRPRAAPSPAGMTTARPRASTCPLLVHPTRLARTARAELETIAAAMHSTTMPLDLAEVRAGAPAT